MNAADRKIIGETLSLGLGYIWEQEKNPKIEARLIKQMIKLKKWVETGEVE